MASPVVAVIPSGWSTTQAWRDWSAAYSTAFGAVGLTRVVEGTAISSPAAFASLSRPSGGVFPAFEIWKFATPATGASEVYLRVAYGTWSANSSYPDIVIAVGDTTDGNGLVMFQGVAGTPVHLTPAQNFEGSARTSWLSYDGDGLAIAHTIDSIVAHQAVFVVDRQRRPDGTAQPNPGWPNTGFMRFTYGAAPVNRTVSFFDPVAGVISSPNLIPATGGRLFPTSAVSMLNASNEMTVFPWWITTRQGGYASKMIVSVPIGDANTSNDLDVPFLGATRTYRALGGVLGAGHAPGDPGVGYAMWWED